MDEVLQLPVFGAQVPRDLSSSAPYKASTHPIPLPASTWGWGGKFTLRGPSSVRVSRSVPSPIKQSLSQTIHPRRPLERWALPKGKLLHATSQLFLAGFLSPDGLACREGGPVCCVPHSHSNTASEATLPWGAYLPFPPQPPEGVPVLPVVPQM